MKYFLILCMMAGTLFAHPIVENLKVSYPSHLQGIEADETGVYWSFTNILVKTDYRCNVLKEVKIPRHIGDMCMVDGDLFVSADFREPKDVTANGGFQSAVLQYSKDLVLKKKYTLNIPYGIDGITFCDGKFYIAPGLGKEPKQETMLMVFDRNFKLLKEVRFKTGATMTFGAQTLTTVNGKVVASYYDDGNCSFVLEPETLKIVGKISLRPSTGLAFVPEKISGNKNTFIIGRLKGKRGDWQCSYRSVTVNADFKSANTELVKDK